MAARDAAGLKFPEQVPQGVGGVVEQHARPGPPHDGADTPLHPRRVAVYRALPTRGLGCPEAAAVEPCMGILQQLPAVIA